MRQQEVIVRFGATQEVSTTVSASAPAMAPDEARHWLDEQFVALDCEPLRASGKVLTVDKLLAVAGSAGAQRFAEDAAWAQAFARAATAALGKPGVVIDLQAMTVQL